MGANKDKNSHSIKGDVINFHESQNLKNKEKKVGGNKVKQLPEVVLVHILSSKV